LDFKIDCNEFMDNVRIDYEGLGMNDSQMITAKGVGITKEQIIGLQIALEKIVIDYKRIWEEIINMFRPIIKDHAVEIKQLMDKINESQIKFMAEPIKNKKGKKLKCWESKRFYQ